MIKQLYFCSPYEIPCDDSEIARIAEDLISVLLMRFKEVIKMIEDIGQLEKLFLFSL